MDGKTSALLATDPRWSDTRHHHVVEIATRRYDPDVTGLGSSPFLGDMGRPGIRVPTIGSTQTTRYLFRLCGVEIPAKAGIIIRGLRQYATIRYQEEANQIPVIVERPIVTPSWTFRDANISWHLRMQPNQFAPQVFDAGQLPATSPEMRGLDAALLYNPPLLPYVPPGAGHPPGAAIGDLGTWTDMRFPWQETNWTMSHYVRGPGAVVMYCSVFQREIVDPPIHPNGAGLVPEDRFLARFASLQAPGATRGVFYGRVAGSLIFEIVPRQKPGPGVGV